MIPETSMYGMTLSPNSLSPNMIQRRGVLPTGSLGFSPPPPMLSRISPHGSDDGSVASQSDIMPPPISKVGEGAAQSAPATITSKDVAMDAVKELRVPKTQSPHSSSRGGSPQRELEPHSESFGHKKFDKFRKAASAAAGEGSWSSDKDQGEVIVVGTDKVSMEEAIEVDAKDENQDALNAKTSPLASPSSGSDSSCTSEGSKARRSAKDAHPNLLAYLNSPAQANSMAPPQPGPTFASPMPAAAGFPWQHLPQHAAYSKELLQTASAVPTSVTAPQSSGTTMEMNSKEQFHAATVSNLKEKLMRKFDSSENLHKAASGPQGTVAVSSATSSGKLIMLWRRICALLRSHDFLKFEASICPNLIVIYDLVNLFWYQLVDDKGIGLPFKLPLVVVCIYYFMNIALFLWQS